jgi:hypothetical protein
MRKVAPHAQSRAACAKSRVATALDIFWNGRPLEMNYHLLKIWSLLSCVLWKLGTFHYTVLCIAQQVSGFCLQ